MVKKIICSGVKYAYAFEVETISAQINLKSGYTLKSIKANSAVLSQESKTGDAGPYSEQSLAVSSNDSDPGHSVKEQDLIFQLTTEDGSVIILGSVDQPMRFDSGATELEGFRFVFKRLTTDDLL